ncbi:hypothetical protein JCM11491_001749 [Sporobolomyces phaffii]
MQRFRRSRSESKKRKDSAAAEDASRRSSTATRHSTATSHERDGEASSSTAMAMSRSTSTSSSLVLPEPEEFRTSLILPHLTARFELLRGTDGQLVDYETLTSHLDEQRKTGRLTTFEMDAVLKQYKLQTAYEAIQHPGSPGSAPQPTKAKKKKRIDWSGVDLEQLAAANEGGRGGSTAMRTPKVSQLSIPSTSPRLDASPAVPSNSSFLSLPASIGGGSPTSSRNSFVSFLPISPDSFAVAGSASGLIPPHPSDSTAASAVPGPDSSPSFSSPASSSSTTWSSPNPNLLGPASSPPPRDHHYQQQPYIPRKPGGSSGGGSNSMFGGRVGSSGMTKSLSSSSVASQASSYSRRRMYTRPPQPHESEADEEGPTGRNAKGKARAEDKDVERRDEDSPGTEGDGGAASLTPAQFKRISTALDSLQDELSKTLATTLRNRSSRDRIGEEVETEKDANGHADDGDGDEVLEAPDATAHGSDTEPIDPFYSRQAVIHGPPLPVPPPFGPNELTAAQTPLPPSRVSLDSLAVSEGSIPPRQREDTGETDATETPLDEADLTVLAASVPLPRTTSDSIASIDQRDSMLSVTSGSTGGGSSFHEAREDIPVGTSPRLNARDGDELSEDELELRERTDVRESKFLDELPPPLPRSEPISSPSSPSPPASSPSSPSARSIGATNLDRLPPSELLALAAAPTSPAPVDAVTGDDLVLSDLVVIQEALVRRAEERKGMLARQQIADPEDLEASDGEGEEEVEEGEAGAEEEQVEEEEGEQVEDDDDDDGDASSSLDTGGMGSRKDSVESGVTSTGAFDFGEELAGLGFSSLPTSPSTMAMADPARISRRMSKRRESSRSTRSTATSPRKNPGGISVIVAGPSSSAMELGTSQSSSSPNFTTNSAITPSTTQSDAFEFSSLAGSPDVARWTGREEQDYAEELEDDEPCPVSRSPAMRNLSIDRDDNGLDEPRDEAEDEEAGDHVAELPRPAETVLESNQEATRSSLGAPVQLDDAQPPLLRVPRNMPRRDPASTPSMLIRDVRNQATLATFALKKTPTSPPSRTLSKKSIRKGSISSPQLVQAPADMATVPIVPNSTSPSSRPQGTSEGPKSKGLGLRFKMLLKKQSRDQLALNGDEVTPFVDFSAAETTRPSNGPPPVTPPNQATARFASPAGSGSGSDFPQTPVDDPTTPLAKAHLAGTPSVRSPPRRPPPPSLEAVEELAERSSPPISVGSDPSSRPAYPASPVPSTASAKEARGLNRFVSRLRRSPIPPTSRHAASPDESILGSTKTSLDESASRTSSRDEEPSYGLGIENDGHRQSQEEQFERAQSHEGHSTVASTAPLSVGRNSQASLPMQTGFTFPPDAARNSRASGTVTRTSGHPVRVSTDSMQRLWEAAEDLGLPPDKVQELVDSAYAQSPTTSHGRSGSMGSSSVAHRSNSTNSPRRHRSSASRSHSQRGAGESASSHIRHASETSSNLSGLGHGRKGSTSSARSLQDRAPTPPPGSRHHRKASLASSREAGPIPDLPHAYSSNSLPPSSSAGSRLSVAGSQYPPPASPSLGSIMSSRRSGYADSFLDFYAQASDDYDEPEMPPVPPLSGQYASERSLAAASEDFEDRTFLPTGSHREGGEGGGGEGAAGPGDEHDEIGGEVVWQVLSDLRNNRLSTLSKDSSFGFDSRDSSFEVEHGASENGGGGTSTDRSESIANMLRHRDRKRSSASMPPFQAGGRFPSIYVRDEQKLLDLGQHGGVAREQQGHFFVRPKGVGSDDGASEVPGAGGGGAAPPPLPEQYRQLIASASSRSAVPPPQQTHGRQNMI